ncbi:unnamed protein product [Musa textilis]
MLFSDNQENCCNLMHFVIFFVSSMFQHMELVLFWFRMLFQNVCLHFMGIPSGLETLMMNRILDATMMRQTPMSCFRNILEGSRGAKDLVNTAHYEPSRCNCVWFPAFNANYI